MHNKTLWLAVLLLVMSAAFSAPMLVVKAQEPISLQEAIGIAQTLYPSAQVVKTEFVATATPPYYVIGLDNGRSVFINAVSREIIQIATAQAPSVAGIAPPTPIAPSVAALVSFERARQIAQERFPNAQVLDAKLEQRGRRHNYDTVWSIKLSNGYDVKVSATSGAIVEIKVMRQLPYAIDPAAAAISQSQAEQLAASTFGDSAVFSRLHQKGRKHGYALVWEVLLSNGYRVSVSATTGAIIEVRSR
jgi:uncharacterized membrane protein YkoI